MTVPIIDPNWIQINEARVDDVLYRSEGVRWKRLGRVREIVVFSRVSSVKLDDNDAWVQLGNTYRVYREKANEIDVPKSSNPTECVGSPKADTQ